MEKDLRLQQRLRQQVRQTAAQDADTHHCHNCGAPVEAGARFCGECGAPQGGGHCVSCGAEIDAGLAICPVCGHPATTRCTFCGSEMSAGERFCPECGNPRGGIVCPRCNTLNYRSFCRACNHPLNRMALDAVARAKADPRYIRASAIAEELQDLEDEIEQLQALIARETGDAAGGVLDTSVEVSDETRRLLDEFERLSQRGPRRSTPPVQPEVKADTTRKPLQLGIDDAPRPAGADAATPQPRRQFSDATARLEQLREQYGRRLDEFRREVDAMIPDPALPPEIRRNEACAHMIITRSKTTRVEKTRVGWVCNRCHIFHNNPSECGVAEFGGKWITKEFTVETETISTGTVNL
ncbi:MAG: zinc ribbon domain-containing protein [Bacteroidales bacterium]|nr:zinc ribbon domain-containing protein [Bacteroidales bacterium]